MVKRLIWSEKARNDRKEILEYWIESTGSPKYSIQLRNEFKTIVKLLLNFPELGIKLNNYDARVFIKGDYKIFYDLKNINEELSIEILHIWDTRRNPEELEL